MGFTLLFVACESCKLLGMRNMITINEDYSPSIPVRGRERPVCRQCFDFYNEGRISKGLDPVPLHPKAYVNTP